MTDNAAHTITVFYSWQSDLPNSTNRSFIGRCLERAKTALEQAGKGQMALQLDEATRGEPGSPDIPSTILDKILQADVFLCDLTTINRAAGEGTRPVPNPNVTFELGYAVAHLGWSRVVIAFNSAYGSFPGDLPFDIERRRAIAYALGDAHAQDSRDEIRNRTAAAFRDAIAEIVRRNPLRPAQLVDTPPTIVRRRRDVKTLREVLSTIYVPVLDKRWEEGPRVIRDIEFFFWEGFRETVESSLFYLYDPRLRTMVDAIHHSWRELLSHDEVYQPLPHGQGHVFSSSFDMPMSDEQQRVWDHLEASLTAMRDAWLELTEYVRADYVEIDPEECNAAALEAYRAHEARMKEIFGE